MWGTNRADLACLLDESLNGVFPLYIYPNEQLVSTFLLKARARRVQSTP